MPGLHGRNTRRDFLKKGLAAAAGLALGSPSSFGSQAQERSKESSSLKTVTARTLGRTGIKIPILSLGASADPTLIARAYEAGVRHFDTAYRYGGGGSERMIGAALKGKPRESFIAATKVLGLRDNRTGLIPSGVSPAEYRANFKKMVDTSLKRLNVDYLDILFLHGIETPALLAVPFVQDVLVELKNEGKTRFLGATFHHKELELIPAVVREKIYDVILTSHNFRQPHRLEVREAIGAAARAGLGIIAMKTIAGAYWDAERKHPVNGAAALKWLFQDENVHSTIPGAQTLAEVELDIAAMASPTLTPREEEDLRFGERNKMAGLYCDQCGECRLQCRNSLDIPALMRGFMYAYGYKSCRMAKELLAERPADEVRCRGCASCAVACRMGFDVSRRARDVLRLLEIPDEFLA